MKNMRMRRKLEFATENSNNSVNSEPASHFSASSISKALKRAETSLPASIEKKKIVLQHLAKRHSIFPPPTAPIKRPRKNFEEIKKAVLIFYENDTISRQNPGIRDFVRIKNDNGITEWIQTFTLTMTLQEAHSKFKENFPELQIELAKFSSLRPKHVKLYSFMKHETCLCSYCENIQLMASAFSKFLSEKSSVREFLSKLCCSYSNFDCASGDCDECSDVENLIKSKLQSCCGDELTNYYRWEKNDNFYQRNIISDDTVNEVIAKFIPDFTSYKLHCYVQNEQKNVLKESIEELSDDEILIICDYAERFTTRARREIQSSYFGKKLISLFTARMYIGKKQFSYIIASDDNTQSKFAVYACITRLLEIAKGVNENLKHLKIFSDGCASQFKNRFGITNLINAPTEWGLTAEWNFFGTGHGKSACDGLGGSIKRGVHRKVIAEDSRVYCAAEFVSCALSFVKNMEIIEITTKEIEDISNFLKPRWAKVNALTGLRSFHHFKHVIKDDMDYILASTTSRGMGEREFLI